MITFWEVILSLFLGSILGAVMVWTNKRYMEYYKDEYAEWWTTKKYTVLFITTTLVGGFFFLFGWFY